LTEDLLRRLIRILDEGGTHTYSALAQRLGISEMLLEGMLQDLTRMGYLRAVGGVCDTRCAACPLASACAVGQPGRIWVLTDRGRRSVERQAEAPEQIEQEV